MRDFNEWTMNDALDMQTGWIINVSSHHKVTCHSHASVTTVLISRLASATAFVLPGFSYSFYDCVELANTSSHMLYLWHLAYNKKSLLVISITSCVNTRRVGWVKLCDPLVIHAGHIWALWFLRWCIMIKRCINSRYFTYLLYFGYLKGWVEGFKTLSYNFFYEFNVEICAFGPIWCTLTG